MKYFKHIMILMVSVLVSCSGSEGSSDDGSSSENPQPLIQIFNFKVNGVDKNYGLSYAYRKEHTILIGNENPNTTGALQISFDENGHFGKMIYMERLISNQTLKYFYSNRNYSSQHFTLIVQNHDPVRKQVKGTFAGYLYVNPEDLNSESKYVSGEFDLPIADIAPPVSGLINEATINNEYWRSTNNFQADDDTDATQEVNLHCLRDDEYKMTFTFHKTNTLLATYNFTPTSVINKIKLAKYDLNTSSYINYECTGTLQIQLKQSVFFDGVYSFTAVNPNNPNDIIQVQNGKFRLNYPYR